MRDESERMAAYARLWTDVTNTLHKLREDYGVTLDIHLSEDGALFSVRHFGAPAHEVFKADTLEGALQQWVEK